MKIKGFLGLLRIIIPGLTFLTACTAQSPVVQQNVDLSYEVPAEPVPMKKHASGSMLARTCFGCHGPDGRSKAPAIPSLAGLSESYFTRVMRAYQYGGRFSSVMGRIALGFDQAEIAQLASYFSQFEFQPNAQRVSWSQVNKGRQLHRLYCQECHGDLRQKPDKHANVLNGRWMDYLRWTLQDYLIGINQADAQMSERLTQLVRRYGNNGLEALINYYGSARP